MADAAPPQVTVMLVIIFGLVVFQRIVNGRTVFGVVGIEAGMAMLFDVVLTGHVVILFIVFAMDCVSLVFTVGVGDFIGCGLR